MDVQHIMHKCPQLESAYYETLRLVNGAMSIRKVHADTVVSGKLLKADNTVVIPYREMHYNPNVWGDSVSQFVPDRFFQKAKLSSHPSYRPFGGGVSYCPGRHLARLRSVASWLHSSTDSMSNYRLGLMARCNPSQPSI
jgi:cytochrome P450